MSQSLVVTSKCNIFICWRPLIKLPTKYLACIGDMLSFRGEPCSIEVKLKSLIRLTTTNVLVRCEVSSIIFFFSYYGCQILYLLVLKTVYFGLLVSDLGLQVLKKTLKPFSVADSVEG